MRKNMFQLLIYRNDSYKWKEVGMEETLVIDRIEENIAVCENRRNKVIIEIQLLKLPENVKEGTIIKYFNGKYSIDSDEQKNIEKRIAEKMERLWE